MRATILDSLADKTLTATEVNTSLAGRGIDRTKNTVRHHLNELRNGGLVDVVRFEEGRGGTTKHYGANTTILCSSLPDSGDPAIKEMTDSVQPQIEAVLTMLTDEYDDVIDDITADIQPCEYCQTQKNEMKLLFAVLRRAFVQAYQDEQYKLIENKNPSRPAISALKSNYHWGLAHPLRMYSY